MLIEPIPYEIIKAAIDPISLAIMASVGVGMYNSWRARRQADKINDQNVEEARRVMEEQRSHALQDWDKVTSYNTPLQQMERYRNAGLNPQLIYGSAQNSPSAMVKNTSQGAGRRDAGEVVNAIQGSTSAVNTALNQYMSVKSLENDTNLKNAQILNLSSQSDKTKQDTKLTKERWDELVMQPMFKRLEMQANIMKTDKQRFGMPSQDMAQTRYRKGTENVEANIEYIREKTSLLRQEGKLKQSDIDTMERLSASPAGLKLIMDLLKLIAK
jgi:hypothetical protein